MKKSCQDIEKMVQNCDFKSNYNIKSKNICMLSASISTDPAMLLMDMLLDSGMLLKDMILLGLFRGGARGAGWSSGTEMADHGRSRAGKAKHINKITWSYLWNKAEIHKTWRNTIIWGLYFYF